MTALGDGLFKAEHIEDALSVKADLAMKGIGGHPVRSSGRPILQIRIICLDDMKMLFGSNGMYTPGV